MKKESGSLIQFSGYPLRVAASTADKQKPSLASLKKPGSKNGYKEDFVNNPRNWDTGWFTNYE